MGTAYYSPHHTTPHHTTLHKKKSTRTPHTQHPTHNSPFAIASLSSFLFLPTLPLHSLQHTRTDTRTHAHRTTPLPQTTRTKHPHAHNTPCAPHFALHFSFLYFLS